MMRRGARTGLAATVVAVGALVGMVVAFTSSGTGVAACGADLDGECVAIARSFALRTGLMVGVMTIVMQLTVAGLLRMVVIEEQRRLDEALGARRAAIGAPGGAALGVRQG